jgi:hypothetical protein
VKRHLGGIARLDEDVHKWYSYEAKRGWPNLVVERAHVE